MCVSTTTIIINNNNNRRSSAFKPTVDSKQCREDRHFFNQQKRSKERVKKITTRRLLNECDWMMMIKTNTNTNTNTDETTKTKTNTNIIITETTSFPVPLIETPPKNSKNPNPKISKKMITSTKMTVPEQPDRRSDFKSTIDIINKTSSKDRCCHGITAKKLRSEKKRSAKIANRRQIPKSPDKMEIEHIAAEPIKFTTAIQDPTKQTPLEQFEIHYKLFHESFGDRDRVKDLQQEGNTTSPKNENHQKSLRTNYIHSVNSLYRLMLNNNDNNKQHHTTTLESMMNESQVHKLLTSLTLFSKLAYSMNDYELYTICEKVMNLDMQLSV